VPGLARLGRRRQIQPWRLGEDGRVDPAQLRPRVDAQLLDQDRPGPLVGQQRIRLSARAVQGQHELGPQPLPQRLLPDQALQLGHQLTVPSQPQVSLDPILHRAQAQLGQPVGLGRRDVAVSELLERLAPPQPKRLPQHRPCGPGPAVGKGTARLGGQLLKAHRIQGPGPNPQQIAGRAGDQHLAGGAAGAVRLQGPAQPLDVRLQGLGGGGWRLLTPQPPDERVYRHDLVGSCQQQGQQQAFLRPPQQGRAVVSLDLQRPEHPKPHAGSVVHLQGQEKARTPRPLPCHRVATRLPPRRHRPG
jgi:hypothetical protein